MAMAGCDAKTTNNTDNASKNKEQQQICCNYHTYHLLYEAHTTQP